MNKFCLLFFSVCCFSSNEEAFLKEECIFYCKFYVYTYNVSTGIFLLKLIFDKEQDSLYQIMNIINLCISPFILSFPVFSIRSMFFFSFFSFFYNVGYKSIVNRGKSSEDKEKYISHSWIFPKFCFDIMLELFMYYYILNINFNSKFISSEKKVDNEKTDDFIDVNRMFD